MTANIKKMTSVTRSLDEFDKLDLITKQPIFKIWQGYMDEDRTLYSVGENSISGNKVN